MNLEKESLQEILKMDSIGQISEGHKGKIVDLLNSVLANEFLVFTKTLNYHWNIKGPRFTSLHEFLGGHYNTLLEVMDEVAERIKIVGGVPLSTATEMTQKTTIEEKPGTIPSSNDMIATLIKDHHIIQQMISYSLKNNAEIFSEDKGTEDMLVATMRTHEKMIWMLKSSLH